MDLAALVADNFCRLGEALAGLPADAWSRPSLCEGWQVRHVVAHLTMAARYPAEEFRTELAADGFDFQRMSDRLALRDGELPSSRLLADLRSDTMARFEQPGGGFLGSLSHVVIHGLDVSLPLDLGRTCSDDAARAVLDSLVAAGDRTPFGVDLTDQALVAADLDWAFGGEGSRTPVPAGVLIARLAGRRVSG